MLGPIDFVVVGFKGNNFDGSVLEALAQAVNKGIVRVVDLIFMMKGAGGEVFHTEYEDQSEELREAIKELKYNQETGLPLLSESDIAKLAEQLPANTAGGVLVIEHLWAKDIKKALKEAGGFLVADGRIHPDAIETAVKELETAAS